MPDFSSLNFKKQFDDVPSDVAAIGEYGGRVKCMYASWDSADDAQNGTLYAGIANADTMQLCKIPAGARILRLSDGIGDNPAVAFTSAPSYRLTDEDGSTVFAAKADLQGHKLPKEAQLQITFASAEPKGNVFIEYLLD